MPRCSLWVEATDVYEVVQIGRGGEGLLLGVQSPREDVKCLGKTSLIALEAIVFCTSREDETLLRCRMPRLPHVAYDVLMIEGYLESWRLHS